MEQWSAEGYLLEPNIVPPKARTCVSTSSSGGDGILLPFVDEFYWEKQCDEALSEGSKSHCDDFDDETVDESTWHSELFDLNLNMANAEGTDEGKKDKVLNITKEGLNSYDECIYKALNVTDEESQSNSDYFDGRWTKTSHGSQGVTCDNFDQTHLLSSHGEPPSVTSLLSANCRQYKPNTGYKILADGSTTISPEIVSLSPAGNGIPICATSSRPYCDVSADIAYGKLNRQPEDRYTCTKYEIGIRNINKIYLNRLNVVLSLMLVICSIIGIGLFLFYMLSCNE